MAGRWQAAEVATTQVEAIKVNPASVPRSGKDLRRPKPFHGDGDQDQTGAVRRFCRSMELYFGISGVPADERPKQARLYLEGTAADYMHTVVQNLPESEQLVGQSLLSCSVLALAILILMLMH